MAWLPEGKVKAVVNIIHGYDEHIRRYMNVVNDLVPDGYAVFGEDHRGHGKSGGKRCHVNSFEEFIDDELKFMKEIIRKEVPEAPLFIAGHSMGSIIAMNLVEEHPEGIKGLILSGSGAYHGKDTKKSDIMLAKVGSKLFPSVHIKFPLAPDFITHDPDILDAYINDKLRCGKITPRLAEQLMSYLITGAGNAGKIKIPMMLQYGTLDISFSQQQELFDNMGSADKTYKRYEGFKHEVYNETPDMRKVALKDLHEWLNAHC
jgi:alpha-beta hydrolase superfamily lysophospholipase